MLNVYFVSIVKKTCKKRINKRKHFVDLSCCTTKIYQQY